MNNGAFGENFPYSNFHDMNMDWVIKIAKDFLDQYTHLQELIANGETSLQNLTTHGLEQLQDKADTLENVLQEKADNLESLLQEWYNTHSADIANQLADALNDLNAWYTEHEGYLDQYVASSIASFNQQADQKAQQTIASIPADYTALTNTVNELVKAVEQNDTVIMQDELRFGALIEKLPHGETLVQAPFSDNSYWKNDNGIATKISYTGSYKASDAIPVSPGGIYKFDINCGVSKNQSSVMIVDSNYNVLFESERPKTAQQRYTFFAVMPALAAYLLITNYGSGAIPSVYSISLTDISNLDVNIKTRLMLNSNLPQAKTGEYWNCEGETAYIGNSSWYAAYDPINVTAGDYWKVYIWTQTSNKQVPVLFVDNNMNVIQKINGAIGQYNTFSGYVPTGATKLLLTTNKQELDNTWLKFVAKDIGEIETNMPGRMDFRGKTVAIIGDSISTNGNYAVGNPFGNVPEIIIQEADVGIELSAYATYYDIGTIVGGHEIVEADVGTEITFIPVAEDVGKMVGVPLNYNDSATKVWWEVMQEVLEFTPIPVCWSGASISSHEGNKTLFKTSYAWHEAQIRKCGIRTPGSMTRTEPDVIIIYRGVNDMTHTPYAKLTSNYFDNFNWQYPANDSVQDGYGYKEALCLTIKELHDAYPNAKIFLCTMNVFKRINYSHFPTNNGTNSLPQFNDAIREVAEFMGCGLIEFDKDGITFENCYSQGYITDSATTPTHPNNKGHKVMGNKAVVDLLGQCNAMK